MSSEEEGLEEHSVAVVRNRPRYDMTGRYLRGDNLHRYGVSTPTEVDFMTEAACLGQDSLFIFDHGLKSKDAKQRAKAAITICLSCPVLVECRLWSDQYKWEDAVVGGKLHTSNY